MIAKPDPQRSLFEVGHMYRELIEKLPKTSFYRALAELGPRLFSDADWADLYCRGNGRPSISPSLICKVLLLKFHENVSDEEALRRLVYDLRWKYALGCLATSWTRTSPRRASRWRSSAAWRRAGL